MRLGAAKTARESAPRGRYFCTHAAARRLRDKRKTEPSGPVLGLRQFHARARGSIVSRCFLRSANFLLQNYAIRRNATKITLGYCPPLKNTLCNTAKNCASPSLELQISCPTYLRYRSQNNRTVCMERSDSLHFEARAKRIFCAAA